MGSFMRRFVRLYPATDRKLEPGERIILETLEAIDRVSLRCITVVDNTGRLYLQHYAEPVRRTRCNSC
jgi:hypothetical protein